MTTDAIWRPKLTDKFQFLLEPSRYKVCPGGRGRGASWAYALALIIKAMEKRRKIVCGRQFQNSIKESIYKLLWNTIEREGLEDCFVQTLTSITCSNGSEFTFVGFHNNLNSFKSNEGIDILDVEEAESVTEEAWQVIIPTVRKEDSEIWLRFNVQYADDATYDRFITNPPKNSVVKFYTYRDNPFFPNVLRLEMEADRAYRPHEAKNIWDGEPIGTGRKVWQEFNEKIHVKEFLWKDIKAEANCFMAMDPAQHYYPFCLWLAIFPRNMRQSWPEDFVFWIYNEWPKYSDMNAYFCDIRKKLLFSGSLADISREIYAHDMTMQEGIKIIKRGIDTRFVKGSGSGNYYNNTTGIVGEFAKPDNGGLMFFMPAESEIDVQKSIITSRLQYNQLQPMGEFNQPQLYIAPWCKNLIKSLNNHRLEEDSETESEKHKDPSDTLKILFAIINSVKWRKPQPEQPINITQGIFSNSQHSHDSWMG